MCCGLLRAPFSGNEADGFQPKRRDIRKVCLSVMSTIISTNSTSMRRRTTRSVLRPVAKKMIYNTVHPGFLLKPLYRCLFNTHWYAREVKEWFWRSLFATPIFLSRCESFGTDIAVDRVPYINGNVRIQLGNQVRFSGKVDIASPNTSEPVLKIGNGVFIGHLTSFSVAARIEIGDYTSIGAGSQIADTEGHSHYNPMKPIWEVPAGDDGIAQVIVENNVQIGKDVMILKGVTIGARSVIGAGAVVRKSIPPDAVVMGNPGRVVLRVTPPAEDTNSTVSDGQERGTA